MCCWGLPHTDLLASLAFISLISYFVEVCVSQPPACTEAVLKECSEQDMQIGQHVALGVAVGADRVRWRALGRLFSSRAARVQHCIKINLVTTCHNS